LLLARVDLVGRDGGQKSGAVGQSPAQGSLNLTRSRRSSRWARRPTEPCPRCRCMASISCATKWPAGSTWGDQPGWPYVAHFFSVFCQNAARLRARPLWPVRRAGRYRRGAHRGNARERRV